MKEIMIKLKRQITCLIVEVDKSIVDSIIDTYLKLEDKLKEKEGFANVIPSSETLKNALIEIAMILDSEDMNVNSRDFELWKIANDALKSQK